MILRTHGLENGEKAALLRMVVADESSKVLSSIETLFQSEFLVSSLDPKELDSEFDEGVCAPHFVLYISKGAMALAIPRVRRLRSQWPKSIVLLLMPTVQDEKQVKAASDIPAHKIIFKPCSKKKIIDSVENYLSLIKVDDSSNQESSLLSCLMEFAGGQRPELYVAYNRIMPLIMTLCQRLGFDWRYAQRVFTVYMILLSNIDETLSSAFMDGGGRKAKVVKELYESISKMVDLLGMTPATEAMSNDLKYVLKRYDGEGMPKDRIAGQEIPAAARIIRLLLDYHYLLQSGKTRGQSLFVINRRDGWYDEVLVHALVDMLGDEGRRCTRDVYPLGLVAGMEVAEDVYGQVDGKAVKIISRNEILTDNSVDYLQRHCEDILDITEPVKIVEELFTDDGGWDA